MRGIRGLFGVFVLAGFVTVSAEEVGQKVAVRGAVLDADGRPLANAQLLVFGEVKGGREGVPVSLAGDGTFRIQLPAGRFWLVARGAGHVTDYRSFTLENGKPRSFHLELERAAADTAGDDPNADWRQKERDFLRVQRRTVSSDLITRDDIIREEPFHLGELTRLPWGPGLLFDPAFAAVGRCGPWISVDGAPPTAGYGLSAFHPDDVEAVEVFPHDAPFDFAFIPHRCGGLLVVWLRDGSPGLSGAVGVGTDPPSGSGR